MAQTRNEQTGGSRAAPASPDEAAVTGRIRRTVGILSVAVFLVNLDLFIVNIGFPNIQEDFSGTSLSTLSWVLNAYAIVFAALLVPTGRLADIYGRRNGFLAGLLVFVAGSALCAAAQGPGMLIGSRVIQAVGGAMIIPTSLSLLLATVPPAGRPKAIGTWVAVGALAASAGPVVGGLLVSVSWRWIFLVNLPIGLLALVVASRLVQESRDTTDRRLPDLLGTVLLTVGIGALALAIVKGPDWGWDTAGVIGGFVVAAVALAAFLLRSARHPSPVVDLKLLRVRSFAMSNISLMVFTIAFSAMILGIILFHTMIWGYSSMKAGFAIAPSPLVVPFVARGVAVRLAAKLGGPQKVAALGSVIFGIGCAYWAFQLGADHHYVTDALPGLLINGVGIGLALPAFTMAGVASVPPVRFATGSAVLNMFRQIGAVLGIAILIAILGAATPATIVDAFDHSWVFMAVTTVVAGLLALLIGPIGAPPQAAPPAQAVRSETA